VLLAKTGKEVVALMCLTGKSRARTTTSPQGLEGWSADRFPRLHRDERVPNSRLRVWARASTPPPSKAATWTRTLRRRRSCFPTLRPLCVLAIFP
jgi:hypothetical protein